MAGMFKEEEKENIFQGVLIKNGSHLCKVLAPWLQGKNVFIFNHLAIQLRVLSDAEFGLYRANKWKHLIIKPRTMKTARKTCV